MLPAALGTPGSSSGLGDSAAGSGDGRLRVLHFRRLFSNLSESFLYERVTRMAARADVASTLLCLLRTNERERPLETEQLLRIHARSSAVLARIRMRGVRRIQQLDSVLWPLLRTLLHARVRAFGPDVIHAHFGPDGVLIAPLARKLGIPLAVGFYGYDVSSLVQGSAARWRRRYRWLFERAALLVAISSRVADRLAELGAPPEKIRVLPLGVALERFPVAERSRAAPAVVRCVYVGRLTGKKSPVDLVRAFAAARRRLGGKPELELVLAGEGELRRATETEIARLNLANRVRLPGAVSHATVPSLLAGADIYVQHCRVAADGDEEGQGIALLEAAATGLPVVTTDHAGIRDTVVDGETALLSPEGDAEAMGENLALLARSADLRERLGRGGRALVEARFALDDTVERLVRALEAIGGRAGKASRSAGTARELGLGLPPTSL